MAKQLTTNFNAADQIKQGNIINAHHVSQSVEAFTGAEEYDITIKGTVSVKDNNGTTKLKFDGNNFEENESSDAFLVVNPGGTVSYRTGGATGPQGPPGTHGTSGTSGTSLIVVDGTTTSGTSGTSGTTPIPPPRS